MFDRKSGHAINKKEKEAIVYADVYGTITRITVENFDSEEEFLKWKDLLTAINHMEENADHVYRNHNVSLSLFSEAAARVPSMEDQIIASEERKIQLQRIAVHMAEIRNILSETQYRRLWMYCVDGMNLESISLKEGISHQNISKSIRVATKKIKKFFSSSQKQGAKSPQNRR